MAGICSCLLSVLLVSVAFLCEADHECGTGSFCYLKSHTCALCTDCSFYNRENPASSSCSKTPQECGHCKIGFKEDRHTNGRKDSCIEHVETEINPLWIILLIAIILIVLVVGLVCVRRYWRKDRDRINERDPENVEVPPPYYAPLVDLQRRDDPEVSSVVETRNQFSQEKNHDLQEAVPFRTAEIPYENNDEEVSDDNSPVQDENTMESHWVPPVDYGRKTPEPGSENGESSDATDTNQACSRPLSPAHDDSGLSHSSCQTSSTSLRYFECFSSQSITVPQQTASVVRPRSESDDVNDVNGGTSSKRARRDSGTQSLDENVEESMLHQN